MGNGKHDSFMEKERRVVPQALFFLSEKTIVKKRQQKRETHHMPSDLPDLSHTLGFPYGICLLSNPKLSQYKTTTKTQKL